MPVSPKLLITKLPRVPRPFFSQRRKPFLAPRRSNSSSSWSHTFDRHLSRPVRQLAIFILIILSISYLPSLLLGRQEDPSPLQHDDCDEEPTLRPLVEQHSWSKEGSDGSVTVAENEWKDGHPIRLLMAEAKQKWDDQLSRQSATLHDAVETYETRYGRSPPKGFDAWWEFTQRNNVLIVDDYDQIHHSITPFLGLDPALLGPLLTNALINNPYFYEIQLRRNHPVKVVGARKNSPLAAEVANLLEGFRRYLPEDFGEVSGLFGKVDGDAGLVKLSVSGDEVGTRIMGEEFRKRMMDFAERGRYIGADVLRILEDTKRDGAWADGLLSLTEACSWRSLADRKKFQESTIFKHRYESSKSSPTTPVSFIKDALKSYNFCHNPSIIPLHGTYAKDKVRTSALEPQFVLSKIDQSPQILLASPIGFQNETRGVSFWEEKPFSKLLWRGSTTGSMYRQANDFNWRDSHRVRLNTLANDPPSSALTDVLVEHTIGRFGGGEAVSVRRVDARELNEHLFDVGITKVVQCDEDDGTCDEMDDEIETVKDLSPQDASKYRYRLDIDGYGWSTDFRRLLALGQAVFKVTIYPEWNTEWLTPWLHYVPANLDLSDLYHTSSFFLGAPGLSDGNDDLGKLIAEAGQDFVAKHWRWVDLQAYMFRLVLEYRRAMARDRDAMSMGGRLYL